MVEKKLREIKVSDYPHIYLLNLDFNANLRDFSEDQVKKKIEIITTQTKDVIFVCECGEEIIGYIHGSPYELLFSESLVNVLGLVVKPAYRNQGVGTMLLEHLEQWSKDNGFTGMKLLSHPSRIQAHRLYEQRGYKFTKEQRNFIKKLNE